MAREYRQNTPYNKIWDESKHPRDADGKFTDGTVDEQLEQTEKTVPSTPKEEGNLSKSEKLIAPVAYAFNRLNTKHHISHAKEMGYKTSKEYEAAAVEFFNSDKGTLYYSEACNRYYRYEEKTGILCVSVDGVINTFYVYSKKKFDMIRRQDKLHE